MDAALGAAPNVAANGRVVPKPALGASHAVFFELLGNGARVDAGGELLKNATDDLGLAQYDLAIAPQRLKNNIPDTPI